MTSRQNPLEPAPEGIPFIFLF